MNGTCTTLSQGWHLAAVFVLTFAVATQFMSIYLPHASQLRAHGHGGLASYFNIVGAANLFLALLILLPRRNNDSPFRLVRLLGRGNLILRYFIAFGLATALFWFGILLEKLFTA